MFEIKLKPINYYTVHINMDLNLVITFNIKAEHDFELPVSIYEFTCKNTHKYHAHKSQVPMSMGF
jgi:hypothetical protein